MKALVPVLIEKNKNERNLNVDLNAKLKHTRNEKAKNPNVWPKIPFDMLKYIIYEICVHNLKSI